MLTPNDDGLLPCFDCAVLPDALGYRYICPTCGIAARKGETYAAMTEAWNRIQRALEAAAKFGTCDGFTYAEAERADAAYRKRLADDGEDAPATTYGRLDRCPSCRSSIEHSRKCAHPQLFKLYQLVEWLKDEFHTNVGASSEADGYWATLIKGAELGLWPEDQDDWMMDHPEWGPGR